MQYAETTNAFPCQIIKKEFLAVGLSQTAPFPDGFPEAAVQIQRTFWERKQEVAHAVNDGVLLSPYMCNGIYATYFACLEVAELSAIPEGMIGLKLPMFAYAQVTCTNRTIGEGYTRLFAWMKENGCKRAWYGASQMEMYYIDEEAEEEPVELLIPLETT